jgi:hypothetical protein
MRASEFIKSSSNLLKASDLGGKTIPLVVRDTTTQVFDEGTPKQKTKIVLWFENKEKGWALNVTNTRFLIDRWGDETGDWIGKELKIYPGKTDYGGEMVDCISLVQEAPPEASHDDIPF